MTNSFIFGISLTASFLAGVLALFAPCCITFLFPSYLGTVFKSEKKVMFYTLIFALGLSFILIPVALGFRIFVFFFDQFHREIYYLGGLFLILMGITTIKPIFDFSFLSRLMPQAVHQPGRLSGGLWQGSVSVFSLGLISGLSSSCCAPVLFAAVTLTTLSPTIIQALFVSFAYVMGIVFPLFIMSVFYERLTDKISGKNRQKIYHIFKSLGAGIFILSGGLIIIFNFLGKIQMSQMAGYSRSLRLFVFEMAKYFQNPIVDILSFILILIISYWLLVKKNKKL